MVICGLGSKAQEGERISRGTTARRITDNTDYLSLDLDKTAIIIKTSGVSLGDS